MSEVDVFVSWSGSESRAIAQKLKGFLRAIFPTLEVYLSTEDISSGERWLMSVSGALEAAKFGVVVLTPQNLTKPWIHFEAGALSKSVREGRVVPLLCGLTPIALRDGPLAGFQAELLDESGIRSLVKSIRDAAQYRMDDSAMSEAFSVWWRMKGDDLVLIPDSDESEELNAPIEITVEDLFVQVSEMETQLREIGRDVRSLIGSAPGAHPIGTVNRGLFGGSRRNYMIDADSIIRTLASEGYQPPSSETEDVLNAILRGAQVEQTEERGTGTGEKEDQ